MADIEDLQGRVASLEALLALYTSPVFRATQGTDGLFAYDDKTKLDSATTSMNPNSLVLRDVNGNIPVGVWLAPTLATGWTNKGGTYAGAQYRAVGNYQVFLNGVVAKSSAISNGETIFTLPVGYRPLADLAFAVGSFTGTAAVVCMVVVNTAGAVTVYGGSNNFVGLNGIMFFVA